VVVPLGDIGQPVPGAVTPRFSRSDRPTTAGTVPYRASPPDSRGLPVDIVIRGKNIEVSETLRTAALKHMDKLDRFANGYGRAEIDFSEERNPRIADNHVCEVLVHVKGHLLKAHAAAAEPFAAVSMAVDKIEHQVKRLKEKRVTRTHKGPARVPSASADATDDEEEKEPARIVKQKQFTIKPMSAEEAALQMELLGHDFFFFTSSESGRAAVIYRRKDGDLGLIEATG
jgi:putative sigma-54 modulation protein